jgi:hypothetical protein
MSPTLPFLSGHDKNMIPFLSGVTFVELDASISKKMP